VLNTISSRYFLHVYTHTVNVLTFLLTASGALISLCVILYFFFLTSVKKSLCVSLKCMFLSFGFLQLLLNLEMFSSSKLSIPILFLTQRKLIFFSAFFRVTCSSLTVTVIKFFSDSSGNQYVFSLVLFVLFRPRHNRFTKKYYTLIGLNSSTFSMINLKDFKTKTLTKSNIFLRIFITAI
jgi:hypothetical protein